MQVSKYGKVLLQVKRGDENVFLVGNERAICRGIQLRASLYM